MSESVSAWRVRKTQAAKRLLRSIFGTHTLRAADGIEEALGERLLALDGGLGLFRLVHLLAAVSSAPRLDSILSVGSGEGLHETYLAHKFPGAAVCGVDLRDETVGLPLPNLRFLRGDLLDPKVAATLPTSDFVYSVECLEHIDDDAKVFAGMAARLRPEGLLYLEVPFASEAEQADPQICRRELENHEHVRPGYDIRRLTKLANENGLTVLHIAGAFWYPIQPMVWLAHLHLGEPAIRSHWRTFLEVARLDLREGVPAHRAEATAIKLLARKPGRR
jgi:SAM-dependent methyltransferase